jgi:hypothetical protein
MELTDREWWTLVHGMVLGALFLLAFAGGLAEIWALRPEWVTSEGLRQQVARLKIGMWTMAVVAWLTVITGTWVVYPWYREKLAGSDFAGCKGLSAPGEHCSPRDFLLSNVSGKTSDWHEFGMEWKEHIAWFAPMFATTAAFLAVYWGSRLAWNRTAKMVVLILFVLGFASAAIAGLFGALITKSAPIT